MFSLTPEQIKQMQHVKPVPFMIEAHVPGVQQCQTLAQLDKQLNQIEQDCLLSKGGLYTLEDGTRVRVFNEDKRFVFKPHDAYARSIQHLRALLVVAINENLDLDFKYLQGCLIHYSQVMSQVNDMTTEAFEQARLASFDFMGAITNHLVTQRYQKESYTQADQENTYKQAFQDINKCTELLGMLSPPEDAICTIISSDPLEGQTIQYTKKITFDHKSYDQESGAPSWYEQGVKTYGAWYRRLVGTHMDTLIKISPPCTRRDMPNAANCWETTLFHTNNQHQILHKEKKIRMAITSPFEVNDRKAREQMALDSMKDLLTEERLREIAESFIHEWGALLDEGEPINIPILHQTLIAPSLLIFSERDMIDIKYAANKKFMEVLADISSKMTIQGHKINFDFGQVNNCLNMLYPIILPTNNDIDDSNKLIVHASQQLLRLKTRLPQDDDASNLQIVIDYLQSSKTSLLPFWPFNRIAPSARESKAIITISQRLFNGHLQIKGLTTQNQKDLSELLQASVNLKKLNHESIFGKLNRRFKNLIRIKQIPILAPISNILLLPFQLAKYAANTTRKLVGFIKDRTPKYLRDVFIPALSGFKNPQTAKSCYENIITSKLGLSVGACKSAYDREGESNITRYAMSNRFMRTGKVIDVNGPDKDYTDFLETDVEMMEHSGHQNRICAHVDRIGARKIWGTSTYHYNHQSDEEKYIERYQCSVFRKDIKLPTGKQKEQMLSDYESKKIKKLANAFSNEQAAAQAFMTFTMGNFESKIEQMHQLKKSAPFGQVLTDNINTIIRRLTDISNHPHFDDTLKEQATIMLGKIHSTDIPSFINYDKLTPKDKDKMTSLIVKLAREYEKSTATEHYIIYDDVEFALSNEKLSIIKNSIDMIEALNVGNTQILNAQRRYFINRINEGVFLEAGINTFEQIESDLEKQLNKPKRSTKRTFRISTQITSEQSSTASEQQSVRPQLVAKKNKPTKS